jgi:hypothetical protein
MQDYCIMTDVTADLPPEILKQYGIEALPMPFKLGNGDYTHYADFREVSVADFTGGCRRERSLPPVKSRILHLWNILKWL